MNKKELTEKHSFISDTAFRLKTTVLTGIRFINNIRSPLKKHGFNSMLINEPVIAFSESALWNSFDNNENWILTAGKIENLRIAARKLDGLEIGANEIFSFWQHIGNPNFGKGYVVGREIREGCIVPTIAGGLCQISNALYDAALKANFEIVERHKHTKVIKGSLAEQGRDATVKWNYIDLRFKSNFAFRIEVELNADKLIVYYRSSQKNITSKNQHFNVSQSNKLNDCYSCGNISCYKHPDRTSVEQDIATTTFLLDEKWPEFDNYIKTISTDSDFFVVPIKKNALIKTNRYSWSSINPQKTKSVYFHGIYRAIKLRYSPANNSNVFKLSLELDKMIALAMARLIPIESTHVVISQNLLPFVFETGALGGRTFDVLMTRLPIEKVHERLDIAHSKFPQSKTLNDFRASNQLIQLENKALTKARKVITPHSEIAEIFRNKVEKLSWNIPAYSIGQIKGTKILFPASAIGRKGAYEMKQVAIELQLDLTINGRTLEEEDFWDTVKIDYFDGDYTQIGLVVYPTYIEHQPRQILKAISKGIPVITTAACGLDNFEKVKVVELNNFEQFVTATNNLIKNNTDYNNNLSSP